MLQNVELPRYGRKDLNCVWYHQLHGHVPGAQQEKMLEPEPDEEIQASPHINTAWRYLSTLAPRTDESFGLTFANLSTQPQPGRGGIAVMLAIRTLRGSGAVDHGGREGALIRHALIAVNRGLGQTTLAAAAESLIRHSVGLSNLRLTATEERRDGPVDEWYHRYRQSKDWNTAERKQLLLKYLQSFYTLPEIQEPRLDYLYAGSKPVRQLVYIEHDKQLTYFDLIAYASYLASALHLSSIPDCPWAAVQVGTQFTEPDQGLTIRFVPENTLRDEPGHRIHFRELPLLSARDGRQRLHELMSELFGLSVEPLTEPRLLRPAAAPKPHNSDAATVEVPGPTVLPVAGAAEVIVAETRALTPSLHPPDPEGTMLRDISPTMAIETPASPPILRRTPQRALPAATRTAPVRTVPIGQSDDTSHGHTFSDKTAREELAWSSETGGNPSQVLALVAPRSPSILRLAAVGLSVAAAGLLLLLAGLHAQKMGNSLELILKEVRSCNNKTAQNCPAPNITLGGAVGSAGLLAPGGTTRSILVPTNVPTSTASSPAKVESPRAPSVKAERHIGKEAPKEGSDNSASQHGKNVASPYTAGGPTPSIVDDIKPKLVTKDLPVSR